MDGSPLGVDMIGMKKVPGGALQESVLVDGVAFKRTFSCASTLPYTQLTRGVGVSGGVSVG